MELPNYSLKNTQANLTNKNNCFIAPRPEKNFYISQRNVNTISGEFTYQNPLPRLLPERNFTTPNYFLHNESAVRDFSGVSGVNYFDLEREATELRALEKEQNPNADKASNAEINNEKEKENIAEVEQEPKNNPKKKSVKRKVKNDTDSNVNWQDHEIDLLIQYIGANFDEYRKEPNAIKSKLARLIKTYSEVKKHNEKSGEARKDWVWYDKMDVIFGARENIAPSFIANRSIDIEKDEELLDNKSKFSKKQKKNNVDTIAIAISTMSETRERVWDKKIELEQEKMNKSHDVEMKKLEVERQKWEFEQEKMKLEH
ncbi:hypothetical protein RhiirA5_377057 [Rhizophagus irregularis]|uniref:Uncharacterized protein n=1 Tax=Rhizophagus irregularis TaxID=588596 RepID=A0A2N0PKR7_9GLOM|nr:hypothetical protein RhiirA5_377057 [Rhizophagus irregularis]PKC70609.1 hypothetical protein RhiirA1_500664 [Rhizophagus irregularis]CAB4478939.1 unnamed protein product [Rhizophagus irregularis]